MDLALLSRQSQRDHRHALFQPLVVNPKIGADNGNHMHYVLFVKVNFFRKINGFFKRNINFGS